MSQQTTMQQVIITEPGGPEKLAYESVAIPVPKADEVLVKVHAFGINRPDILQRQGLYPMPAGVTPVPWSGSGWCGRSSRYRRNSV